MHSELQKYEARWPHTHLKGTAFGSKVQDGFQIYVIDCRFGEEFSILKEENLSRLVSMNKVGLGGKCMGQRNYRKCIGNGTIMLQKDSILAAITTK